MTADRGATGTGGTGGFGAGVGCGGITGAGETGFGAGTVKAEGGICIGGISWAGGTGGVVGAGAGGGTGFGMGGVTGATGLGGGGAGGGTAGATGVGGVGGAGGIEMSGRGCGGTEEPGWSAPSVVSNSAALFSIVFFGAPVDRRSGSLIPFRIFAMSSPSFPVCGGGTLSGVEGVSGVAERSAAVCCGAPLYPVSGCAPVVS